MTLLDAALMRNTAEGSNRNMRVHQRCMQDAGVDWTIERVGPIDLPEPADHTPKCGICGKEFETARK